MGNYLNGVSNPILQVWTLANVLKATFDLPLTDSQGLVEDYETPKTRHVLFNHRIIEDNFAGTRVRFTLNYAEYIKKYPVQQLDAIDFYNAHPNQYKLILIPRSDLPSRTFEVRCDGDWSLALHKGAQETIGHKLPVLKFITVEIGDKKFRDPDDIYTATLLYLNG